MAKPNSGTYTFIPPPPLPEFYMPPAKKHTVTTSPSSSSSSTIEAGEEVVEEEIVTGDGAYDGKPRGATIYPPPPVPLTTIPLTQTGRAHEVPPLAVYHICRLCLRPRSPRYHRDHPIPINGLPPPPGICRRCRVTSIETTKKVAEVVTESRSNNIKIGFLQPFVKDEDIISGEDTKKIRTEQYLKRLAKESQPRKDITYRHVSVRDERVDPPPSRRTKVAFSRETTQDDADEPEAKPAEEMVKETKIVQAKASKEPPNNPTKTVESAALHKMDSSKASVSAQSATSSSSSSSSTSSSSEPTVKSSTQVSKVVRSQPSCTGSEVRKIAREEIDRYRDQYFNSIRDESSIRKLAREEVERYRQAERKLEAHPDPYAHGRLVPIERRIETPQDSAEPMPWVKTKVEEKVAVYSNSPMKPSVAKEEVSIPRVRPANSESNDKRGVSVDEAKVQRTKAIETKSSGFKETKAPTVSSTSSSTSSSSSTEKQDLQRDSRYQVRREKVHAAAEASRSSRERYESSSGTVRSDPKTGTQERTSDRFNGSYATKPSSRQTERQYHIRTIQEEDTPPREPPSVRSWKATPEIQAPKPPKSPTAPRPPEWDISLEQRESWNFDNVPEEQSVSQTQQTWSKASQPSGKTAWHNDSVVRTIDTHSSKYFEASGSGGTPADSRAQSFRGDDKATKAPRPRMRPDPEGEMTYIPATRYRPSAARDLQVNSRRDLPYPEHDITPSPMISSSDKAPLPPKDDAKEYLYAVRTVQPADRPRGRTPFDDHRPAQHVEVEEVVEWRRTPKAPQAPRQEYEWRETWRRPHSPPPSRGPPPRLRGAGPSRNTIEKVESGKAKSGHETEEIRSSFKREEDAKGREKPREEHVTMRVSAKRDDDSNLRKYKQDIISDISRPTTTDKPRSKSSKLEQNREKVETDDDRQDPRVQFASKIDISPTPPRSDASSSEIREFHEQFKKVGHVGARMLDGNQSPENIERFINGSDQRGRVRERGSVSVHDDADGDWSRREQGYDTATRRRGERRDERRGARALARALSESPSRELLTSLNKTESQQGMTENKGKDPTTRQSRNTEGKQRIRADQQNLDSRGPCREWEKVTDSMKVEDGSSPGRGHGWW